MFGYLMRNSEKINQVPLSEKTGYNWGILINSSELADLDDELLLCWDSRITTSIFVVSNQTMQLPH